LSPAASAICALVAAGSSGHGVEQLGLMPDRQQDGQAGTVDRAHHTLCEFLGGVGGVFVHSRHD